MTFRTHATSWLVTRYTHNQLVDAYNDLESQLSSAKKVADVTSRELGTAKNSLVEARQAAALDAGTITQLRTKIKELEAAPSFQNDLKLLQEKVSATNISLGLVGKTFDKLRDLWNWRLSNGKAGPKALSENRDQINSTIDAVYQQLPTKVGK